MEIMEPIMASHIELEIKGGEKTSFIYHWTETERDGDETRTVHRERKCKHSKKFLEYKNKVFDIEGGMLNPGVYQVEFQTELPEHIPSSLYFKKSSDHHNKPKAKVKYYIKATLHAHDKHDDMKYKQVLNIREKPVAFAANAVQSETSNVKTWCCCDQGTSSMSSVFNKNVFMPNELAEGKVVVDNSNCQLNVTRVNFFVEQVLHIHADG